MRMAKTKILAMILMLVTFTGQAMSLDADPCQMDMMPQAADQSGAHPCTMSMAPSPSEPAPCGSQNCNDKPLGQQAEHCDTDCHCPSGDISVAIVKLHPNSLSHNVPFKADIQGHNVTISQLPFRLFRPPIFL